MSIVIEQRAKSEREKTDAQNAKIQQLRDQIRRGANVTHKLLNQLLELGVTIETIREDEQYGTRFSADVAIVAGRDDAVGVIRAAASSEADLLKQQQEADQKFREQRQATATRQKAAQRQLSDSDKAIRRLWDLCPIEIKQTRSKLKQESVASRHAAQDLKGANDRERLEINRLKVHAEKNADEIEMRKRRIAANEAKILEVEQQAADLAEQSDSLSRTWFLDNK